MNSLQIHEILSQASERLITLFSSSYDIFLKQDKSPVTRADQETNDFLIEQLSTITSYPILSEESFPNTSNKTRYTTYWLLDPLDGTKEFIKQSSNFCINLALINNGSPIWGCIAFPFEKKNYEGDVLNKQLWVYDQQSKKRSALSNESPSNIALNTLLITKSHQDILLQQTITHLKSLYPKIHTIEMGSAIKFIHMIQKKSVAYFRTNPTYYWDIAAGHALLNTIDGNIYLYNGFPIQYPNNKETLLQPNPPFFAVTSEGYQQWFSVLCDQKINSNKE